MQIDCMRAEIETGGYKYPIYIGFVSAEKIAKVSVAPAFNQHTPHQQIAENISTQPVRDWQRPLDQERVERIADAFNDTGKLMPNPVLLAKNAFVNKVHVTQKHLHGHFTGQHVVNIEEDEAEPDQRALWILDGQHRITGLSRSTQSSNPVPVVFLLDDLAGSYASPLLASIFAQVTTAAAKLDELHNEWLTYAFDLGRYSNSAHAKSAFACAVELCRTPSWGSLNNPFFNKVQFNDKIAPSTPVHGGFPFSCKEFSDLFERHYYGCPSQIVHLQPSMLAHEISRAYISLFQSVQNQDASVFFHSDRKKQQRIIQEAFIVGVLKRTLTVGSTSDYNHILQGLAFPITSWDLTWVRGLSGRANAVSKKIAIQVFSDAIVGGALPTGSSNLADYLRGNGASVTLTCRSVNEAGRPIQSGKTTYVALRGATGSHPVATTRHIKVTDWTSNVGEYEIIDATSRGRPLFYREMERRGLLLKEGLAKPLEIVVSMQHYGENFSKAEVTLNW